MNNALGQITSITDSKKRRTIYEYGPGGMRKRAVYPDGSFESFTYDKNKNVIRRQNHKGDYLEFQYDCLNRMTEVKSSFGRKLRYAYDDIGNVISVKNELGHVTKCDITPEGKQRTCTGLLKPIQPLRYMGYQLRRKSKINAVQYGDYQLSSLGFEGNPVLLFTLTYLPDDMDKIYGNLEGLAKLLDQYMERF